MINKIDAPSHKSTSWNLSFKDPGRPVHLTRPNLTKPFTFFARRRGPKKHQPLNWSSIVHNCLFTVALLPRNDRRQPIFWKKWHGDWKSCVSPSDNVVSDCVVSTLIEDHFSVYMLVCAHRPVRPQKKITYRELDRIDADLFLSDLLTLPLSQFLSFFSAPKTCTCAV
jgi:hypothetical protein